MLSISTTTNYIIPKIKIEKFIYQFSLKKNFQNNYH